MAAARAAHSFAAMFNSVSRRTKVTVLVSSGIFMASLDLSIVNIAFPAIQSEFAGSSLSDLSWLLSAYAIVFAAALVPSGRWFDRVGRKRGFLLGVGLFGLASAICAAAPTLEVLIAARVLQALGAAMLTPTSLGLLLPEYPSERRAAVMGLWSAVGGIAAAAGPPVGGLLVELDWRWVFLVNVPIALAALLVGRTLLNEIQDPEPGPRPDITGAGLLVAAVALLTWDITGAPDHGWFSARTLGTAAVAAVCLGLLAARSRTHAAPIVPPHIVRHPSFSLAAGSVLLFYVAFSAMLLNCVLLLTTLWGYSTITAGLALIPGPAMAAAVASRSGVLVPRFGARPVAVTGTFLFAAGGLLATHRIGPSPAYASEFLVPFLMSGAGVGLALPALANAAVSTLPEALLSTGIAVFAVSRQIGAALGVAVLVAVFATPTSAVELLQAIHDGYRVQCAAAALALLTAGLLGARVPRRSAEPRHAERPVAA